MERGHETGLQQRFRFDALRNRATVALGVFAVTFTAGLAQRVEQVGAKNDDPEALVSSGFVPDQPLTDGSGPNTILGTNSTPFSAGESTSNQSATPSIVDLAGRKLPVAHESVSASKLKLYSSVNSPSFLKDLNKSLKKCYKEPAFVNPNYGRSKKFRNNKMKYGHLWLEFNANDATRPELVSTELKWTSAKNTTFCAGWGSTSGRNVFMIKPDFKNEKGEYVFRYPFSEGDPKSRDFRAARVFFKHK